jgi:hypothetical protein
VLPGISILAARIGSLIHPKSFQVNQIVLRRIIFQLGRPTARFALTVTGTPSSEAFLGHHSILEPFLRPTASLQSPRVSLLGPAARILMASP